MSVTLYKCRALNSANIIMAALCNRAGHYIFALWFLLSSIFLFPRLISAVATKARIDDRKNLLAISPPHVLTIW